ncbi:fibronectin-binding protein A N-terminus-domain-containing protein [Copromyces sp. CBS 386.78]|nr:fibronectin-binding protein A N-terminus-domain-containing protein [Copromyces sp. CBS 386.78]
MKQRFSSLDVRVVAHELSEALVSLRLANIYDLNSKILLLKFAKPDNRQQLLIESGFRCHLTDFVRTASPAPSQFVARLRKYLKTRRCTSVSQIGTDRIIEVQFSDGAFRLYLEFFASGNIILTDSDLKILALLRNVPEGEGQEPQRIGLTYTLENRQNFGGVPALTKERLRDALQSTVQKVAADQAAGKKIKKKGADELRRGLATTITELPPILVDHVFRLTSFDPATKPAEILDDDSLLDKLFDTLQQAREILDEVTDSSVANGYIIAKPRPGLEDAEVDVDAPPAEKAKSLLYEDFQPFLPKQFEDNKAYRILPFVGYNKTVDEFFSSLEGQRLESKLSEREAAAKRKLEAARMDQAKRIEGLQEMEMLNYRKAATIQANIERVQEAMDAVNGLLQEGMDWVDITKLIEKEQKLGNPVAEIIKLPMKLKDNTITLLLGEGVEEEEESDQDKEDDEFDYSDDEDEGYGGEETTKNKAPVNRLEIDINLTLSVWNNASEYYDQKRTAHHKAQKTVQQSVIALKSAEQKISEDLRKGLKQEKPVLQPIRKAMWFEKFTWFISSDGYLVLGGRDAQQNEMLYKRHLRKGDVYVHADVHGAASVIIKNNPKTPDAPIPPSTLAQAGNLSVCCSSAWDSKAGMGAWWVTADQVSKSAPTGEYLPVGSFMVRGKRNLLPPALLTLGFGLLFRISDDSKSKHTRNRVYDFGEGKTRDRADSLDVLSERAESPHEQKPEAGQESESEDEDEDAANQKARSNPLHSQHSGQDESGESDVAQAAEPPTEELADLEITEEPASNPDEDSKSPAEPEPAAAQDEEEEVEDEEEEDSNQPSSKQAGTPSSSTAPQKQQPPKKAPAKRGQRAKQKKIAAKYKDQDEEDRALMEELMGVKAARQKAEAEAAAKAKAEAEAAAARERRRQQQERVKKEIAEHEEVRRLIMEEGEDMPVNESEMAMEMAPLETLVGTPLAGDEILEVVPICAPWNALNKVKYKTKLQPGNTKKGKAVKEIVERWRLAGAKKGWIDESSSDPEKIWPREIELIKGLKVEEAFNCVPVSKVTVMQSGGLAGSSSGGGSGKGGGGKGNAKGGKGKKK